MSLLRLSAGFAAVAVWFLLFELAERRLLGMPGPRFRAPWATYVSDALLFTLLASLWFASLGSGGWLLLFAMLGLVLEGPGRYRDREGGFDGSRAGIKRLVLGVVRIVGAGCWLWLIL